MDINLALLSITYVVLTAFFAWRGFIAHFSAAFCLLTLPVLQILFIYTNGLDSVFIYDFTPHSLLLSTLVLYVVGIILLINSLLFRRRLLSQSRIRSFTLSLNSMRLLSILSIFLSLVSVYFSNLSVDGGESLAGRGTFSGVGSVMGLIIVMNFISSRMKQSLLSCISILTSFCALLYLSRIFFIVNALAISAPYLRRKRASLRLSLLLALVFIAVVFFLYSGEFKHLLGRGFSFEDSVSMMFSYNPFLDTGSSNLGFSLTYTIGVEAGSSLADCINTLVYKQDYLSALYSLFLNSLSVIPGFITRSLGYVDSYSSVCTQPIVQSVLHLLIQSFDVLGVIIFSLSLSFFCIQIDSQDSFLNKFFPSSYLFAFLPVFWVRGSLGLSISISVAVSFSSILLSKLLGLKRILL